MTAASFERQRGFCPFCGRVIEPTAPTCGEHRGLDPYRVPADPAERIPLDAGYAVPNMLTAIASPAIAAAPAEWYCEHGYRHALDCPDCDVPAHLPTVLDGSEA